MIALLARDLALARGGAGGAWVGVLFLAATASLIAFGVGSELAVLRRIGPGVLWAAALLAALLGLERLFAPDREDGTMDLLATAPVAWEAVAGAKAVAHWLCHAAPLVAASPVLALLFGLSVREASVLALTLLVGTPTLSLVGTLAAALGLQASRGGMLTAVIAVPFALPTLIFGAAAAQSHGTPAFLTPFLLLAATTLFAAVLMPFATAAALRAAMES